MKSSQQKMFLKKLEKYRNFKHSTYLLYGSKEALQLYEISVDQLIQSSNVDYWILALNSRLHQEMDTILDFDISGFKEISIREYEVLYLDLCKKLRATRIRRNPLILV